jgi:hypothetical protein
MISLFNTNLEDESVKMALSMLKFQIAEKGHVTSFEVLLFSIQLLIFQFYRFVLESQSFKYSPMFLFGLVQKLETRGGLFTSVLYKKFIDILTNACVTYATHISPSNFVNVNSIFFFF